MNDLLNDLGYNADNIDVLHADCARSGIDTFVYHAWDDYDTSIDGDALGTHLANQFPDLADTWTGEW
jgi:hypothetical protein